MLRTGRPITTYAGRGTAKPGVDASTHAIIYMSNSKPSRLQSEAEMIRVPLKVEPADPSQKLDPLSRVNFAKMYTVEHNVRVMPVGQLSKSSQHLLVGYWMAEVETD